MAGYLVFDVESVPDGSLLSRVRHPGLTPQEAIVRAERDALAESNGRSDFIPYTFHVPVTVGFARLDDNFLVRKVWVINGTEDNLVASFWHTYAREPVTFVTFNGRTFDLPLLELMAFKHGITIPQEYWAKYGP